MYIETSVVSYLTARPSRDPATLARQHLTATWWTTQRLEYQLFVSPLVLEEAELGNREAAAARLAVLRDIEIVVPPVEADDLALMLLRDVPLPDRAAADAVHIAAASIGGADYLLTWNFKHIANPGHRDQIARICRTSGYHCPRLCTPQDLIEGTEP